MRDQVPEGKMLSNNLHDGALEPLLPPSLSAPPCIFNRAATAMELVHEIRLRGKWGKP